MQNLLGYFRTAAESLSNITGARPWQNEAIVGVSRQVQQPFTPPHDWHVSINQALQNDGNFEVIRTIFQQTIAKNNLGGLITFVNVLPAPFDREVASLLRQQKAIPAAALPSLLSGAISQRAWPTVTFLKQAASFTSEPLSIIEAALINFVEKGDNEGVKALFMAMADALPHNASTFQLIEKAIVYGHQEVAVTLLQGMAPNPTTEPSPKRSSIISTFYPIFSPSVNIAPLPSLERCLQQAHKSKMLDVAALIEEKCGGLTPQRAVNLLVEAVRTNRPIAARVAMKWGANPNLSFSGATFLMQACEKGHKDVAEVLIENGAALDTQDPRARTALSIAAEKGDIPLVQLLLESGANVSLGLPLEKAVASGKLDVVKVFFDVSADDGIDISRLLCRACSYGYLDIAQFLLEKGASVTNNSGSRTALDEAFLHMIRPSWDTRATSSTFAIKPAVKLVELLLSAGARTLSKSAYGGNPFPLPLPNSTFWSLLSENAHAMLARSMANWPCEERQKWLSLKVKNEIGTQGLYIDHLCQKGLLSTLFAKIGGITRVMSMYDHEKEGQPFSSWFKLHVKELTILASQELKNGNTAFFKEIVTVSFAVQESSAVFGDLYVGIDSGRVSAIMVLDVLQELGLCEWNSLYKWLNIPLKPPLSMHKFMDCLDAEGLKHLFANKGGISHVLDLYASSGSQDSFSAWSQASLRHLFDQAFLAAANQNAQGRYRDGDNGAFLQQVLTLASAMNHVQEVKNQLKAKMLTFVLSRDIAFKAIGDKLGPQKKVEAFLREVDRQLEVQYRQRPPRIAQ